MSSLDEVDPAEVDMDPERIDIARRMVRDHVASGGSPTAALLVMRQGEVVIAQTCGLQRPDGPDLQLDHLWPITSAGKPLVASVVMSLVEEGLIGIMDPVLEHLPELEGEGNEEVLIHHLLTHSAGWESPMFSGRVFEVLASGEVPDPPPGVSVIEHTMRWLSLHPIRFCEVGEVMCYGNVSYALLGDIVRRVTGGTLDAALRKRVLEPLGMTHSALIVSDDQFRQLVARAPQLPLGADSPMSVENDDWRRSDAGWASIYASPVDISAFCHMILRHGEHEGEQLLAESTVRSMCTDQIPGTPARFGIDREVARGSWGYGFSVICEQRWPWFGGALIPNGCVTHPGAGGIDYWIDFENDLIGVFFEILTKVGPSLEPISGIGHRLQDVIAGAVL